jgi:hypothetical protein
VWSVVLRSDWVLTLRRVRTMPRAGGRPKRPARPSGCWRGVSVLVVARWVRGPSCAAHPHVRVLFQVRDGEVMRARGTARYLRDAATMRRVTRASLPKYVLRPRALWFFLRNLSRVSTRSQYTRERTDTGMIEVAPESYTVGPA